MKVDGDCSDHMLSILLTQKVSQNWDESCQTPQEIGDGAFEDPLANVGDQKGLELSDPIQPSGLGCLPHRAGTSFPLGCGSIGSSSQQRRGVGRRLFGGTGLIILAIDFMERNSSLHPLAGLRNNQGCLSKLQAGQLMVSTRCWTQARSACVLLNTHISARNWRIAGGGRRHAVEEESRCTSAFHRCSAASKESRQSFKQRRADSTTPTTRTGRPRKSPQLADARH